MPLAPEARRRDKEKPTPERAPKLFLSPEQVEDLKKRYPQIKVREFRGKKYVDIRDFPSCEFIRYGRKKSTRQAFSFAVLKFCRFKNAFPDDLIETYREDREKAGRDLAAYIRYLEEEGYTGNYIRSNFAGLIRWLDFNGVDVSREELRRRYWITLPPAERHPTSPPTREELRRILIAAHRPVWKALFSFLSATGIRPSEALTLRIGDLHPHPYDAAEEESIIEVSIPSPLAKTEEIYI